MEYFHYEIYKYNKDKWTNKISRKVGNQEIKRILGGISSYKVDKKLR